MKLVMKADDGKEIVYIPNSFYDVGTVDELEGTLIINISKIEKKYKDYLEPYIKENNTKIFQLKKRDEELILLTPDYYYVFDDKINSIIKDDYSDKNFDIAIAYEFEEDNQTYWNLFYMGSINNAGCL